MPLKPTTYYRDIKMAKLAEIEAAKDRAERKAARQQRLGLAIAGPFIEGGVQLAKGATEEYFPSAVQKREHEAAGEVRAKAAEEYAGFTRTEAKRKALDALLKQRADVEALGGGDPLAPQSLPVRLPGGKIPARGEVSGGRASGASFGSAFSPTQEVPAHLRGAPRTLSPAQLETKAGYIRRQEDIKKARDWAKTVSEQDPPLRRGQTPGTSLRADVLEGADPTKSASYTKKDKQAPRRRTGGDRSRKRKREKAPRYVEFDAARYAHVRSKLGNRFLRTAGTQEKPEGELTDKRVSGASREEYNLFFSRLPADEQASINREVTDKIGTYKERPGRSQRELQRELDDRRHDLKVAQLKLAGAKKDSEDWHRYHKLVLAAQDSVVRAANVARGTTGMGEKPPIHSYPSPAPISPPPRHRVKIPERKARPEKKVNNEGWRLKQAEGGGARGKNFSVDDASEHDRRAWNRLVNDFNERGKKLTREHAKQFWKDK